VDEVEFMPVEFAGSIVTDAPMGAASMCRSASGVFSAARR
jgi:hypothetical protein